MASKHDKMPSQSRFFFRREIGCRSQSPKALLTWPHSLCATCDTHGAWNTSKWPDSAWMLRRMMDPEPFTLPELLVVKSERRKVIAYRSR
eukprot:7391699-Prymnesium_polylepis.1